MGILIYWFAVSPHQNQNVTLLAAKNCQISSNFLVTKLRGIEIFLELFEYLPVNLENHSAFGSQLSRRFNKI